MDFLFIGEVNRQLMDRVPVYNVFYALAANPDSIEEVEIYKGSGAGHGVCWRQRLITRETILTDPELVAIIGQAIKIQEDIASR